MRIFRNFMALFMLFAWATSSHAMSIKLDGSGGLSSGTDCQTGAVYSFGTENSYEGQALDLLVEVINADNDYNNGTTYCTYVKDKTLATNLRDTDADDNVAFEEYKITIVKAGTNTPVEVDRVMLTGYDLDINKNGDTGTDDFYVAADGTFISNGSSVTHTSGTFYGIYTEKIKGWTVDNCDDTAATPDATCRASSIWINGNGLNKVSTFKVRVQNDNAYGEYTGDSYAYRLIQLSFQIEDFGPIFNGQKEYGDAPSSYGEAGGNLDATIMLGSGLPADYENAYQASANATADDTTGKADESAVMIAGTTLSAHAFDADETVTLDISTYGSGYLQLWCDFNSDGDFDDNGEHVVDSQHINNTGESADGITTNTNATSGVTITPITLTIPNTVDTGSSFIRVRFSEGNSAEEQNPRNNVSLRGEVEDYHISFRNKGSISGSVKDEHNNPISGVIIKLIEGSFEINTTTTDEHGNYSFSSVDKGDYTLVETDHSDYISVSDNAGDDNSDNSNTNDNIIPVNLTAGENDTDNHFIDEGYKSISGKVLVDTDGDTIGDKGLLGVRVNLNSCDTNTFLNTTTDANGDFHFENLISGCYTLTEVDPSGYHSVKDMDSKNDNNISLVLGDSDISAQIFIDEPLRTVSGNVKADTNFDEIVDTPLEAVTIELFAFDGALLDTVQTDANGAYQFSTLTPGTYTIIETDPQGYSSLSDIDGDNPNTIMITISESDITDQNFEDQKRISISGVVKVDIDGDEIVDEPLKNSTLIICKVSDPCTPENNIAKVITGDDGAYRFDDLTPGDYQIIEIDKEGYESLGDADGANDNTIKVNLTGNGDVTDKDFDNQAVAPKFIVLTKSVAKKQASIGDFVPYSISVENIDNSYNYAALSIRDVLPAGFKYEKGSAKLLRGTNKTAINASGTSIINFGTFNLQAGEKVTISYLLKVGASVAKGVHTNSATANQNGEDVSNTSRASITIIADQFLDNAVIIGKVFEDDNENGIQDNDEKGIPGVRIASVTGMLIETDGYGRYHVADAESGGFGGRGKNYILKVDPTTLPEGAKFTTENPRVHRITTAGLNVIDFGVKLPKVERFSKERKITRVKMQKQQVEVQKSIKIGSIFFDSDQNCIRPDQVKSLCAIANKLKEYQGGSLMIEANTDARAPIWYNKKLAYKRAQSVYKELRAQLGDAMMGKVEVIYDNCDKEVSFDPRYDWWGKPNIPRTKKECTEFGISKKRCNRLLAANRGGAL